MAQPTTGVLFSSSFPPASPGNQLALPQTNGGQPAQFVTFQPQAATSSLLGVVKPDGTTTTVDADGTIHAVGGTGSGGTSASGGSYICVVPSGAKDTSNTQFAIPAPVLAGTAYFYVRNGVMQRQLGTKAEFSVQGSTITTTTPLASDDWHEFYYVMGTPNSESGGGGGVTPVGSPTFIQGNTNYTTGTTVTAAFPSNNSAGDCLVVDVIVQENFFGAGSMSISDSRGNTWTHAMTNNRNNILVETWYALNCAGGANTVTVVYTTSTTHPGMAIAIHEYAAVKTVSAFDADAYGFADSITSLPISLSLTATVAGDLLHLYASCQNGAGATTISNSAGWATRESNGAGTVSIIVFDALATAAGAVSNSINTSGGTPIFIQGYLLALKSV